MFDSLPASVRLLSQFLAVSLVFWLMPASNLYFHGFLPDWLDTLVAVFMWVWFINLFNFMDGIDGISVVEASSIGLGVFILMTLGAIQLTHGLLGLVITASAIGFVWWNWQPAKVFLGDVGSIPLGFLLGWLLLEILSTAHWPAAVILPLYYFADASITLCRRIWRNERVWRAHREHFYQQATARGLSHAQVSLLICGTNILLVGLSIFSLVRPLASIVWRLYCCKRVTIDITRTKEWWHILKILFLTENFPPETNAAATRVYERAIYWQKSGHKVTIITSAPNFPQGVLFEGYQNHWWKTENMSDIKVVRVKTYISPNKGVVLRSFDFLSFGFMGFFVGLFQTRPDIVVATSPQFFTAVAGWAVAACRRLPFIFELGDLWPSSIAAVGAIKKGMVVKLR